MLRNKNVMILVLALSTWSAFGMQHKDKFFLRDTYLEAVQEADEFIIPYLDKFDDYKEACYHAELQLQEMEFRQATPEEKREKEVCSFYALYKHATPDERLGMRYYLSTIMPEHKHLELWRVLLKKSRTQQQQQQERTHLEYALFCASISKDDLEALFK